MQSFQTPKSGTGPNFAMVSGHFGFFSGNPACAKNIFRSAGMGCNLFGNPASDKLTSRGFPELPTFQER